MRKPNCLGSFCLMLLHVMVLSLVFPAKYMHLVWVAPQLWQDTCFPQNVESLLKPFFVYSLGSLLTTTVMGEDQVQLSQLPQYFFHFEGKFCRLHCIFSAPFPICYYGRLCTFHQWVHRVMQHLEKSCFT